ncbi:hypothetical protein ACOSQ3_017587 [Xanthoceras sorbifolium]
MNVQAHMSAGQVPNQGGLPQQNGNALPPNQLQNLVGGVAPGAASGGVGGVPQQHNMLNMDAELLIARSYMRDKIFGILLQRQTQPVDEATRMKFRDISKRLEEGLFKAARTKEDHLNLETLESRLSSLIKGRSGNNHNSVSVGAQSESLLQGQWHPQSQERTHMTGNMSHEQHIQEDFRQLSL